MRSTNILSSRNKVHGLGTDFSVLSRHTGPQTTSCLAILRNKNIYVCIVKPWPQTL